MIGIYGIHNIVNDKWYVGQSVNIEKRWESERLNLRKGSLHQNGCGIHIGNAYKKYGEKSFEWVILEECEKEKLNEREVFWISKKNSLQNGYNSTPGGNNWVGRIVSKETRRKMSEARMGDKNINFGHPLRDEHRKKISDSLRNYKKIHGVGTSAKKVICLETGVIYPSMLEAAKEFGIHSARIGEVCNSKRKFAGGCRWERISE